MSESFTSSHLGGESLVQLANDCRDPAKREQAAAKLWNLLNELLRSRIAVRIADNLQGKISAQSVLQEMWLSFFERQEVKPYDFHESSDVLGLLCTMSRHKLSDRIRRLNAKKRKPHLGVTDGQDQNEASVFSESELLNAEPAEWNNAEDGALAAGHFVAQPEKLKRAYAKEDESPPFQEIVELAADMDADWLNELLEDADPVAAEIVKENIEPLDDDLKTALRLRYVEGRSLEETAQIMDVTIRAVRYKISAIEEAFLDLQNDSMFGPAALKHRPRKSP